MGGSITKGTKREAFTVIVTTAILLPQSFIGVLPCVFLCPCLLLLLGANLIRRYALFKVPFILFGKDFASPLKILNSITLIAFSGYVAGIIIIWLEDICPYFM